MDDNSQESDSADVGQNTRTFTHMRSSSHMDGVDISSSHIRVFSEILEASQKNGITFQLHIDRMHLYQIHKKLILIPKKKYQTILNSAME